MFNRVIKLYFAIAISTVLANCLTFDCIYDFINLDIVGTVYQCRPNVTGSSSVLEHVNGDHIGALTRSDVKHLFVLDKDIKIFLSDIEKFFPELVAISWYNSNLQSLTAEDLKPLPNLIFLGLWMNKLKSLDGDLFKHTPNLQYIDFDSNLIESVGHGLLDPLVDLKIGDFSENSCIDFYARTPDGIDELKNHLRLNCSASDEHTMASTTSEGSMPTIVTDTTTASTSVETTFSPSGTTTTEDEKSTTALTTLETTPTRTITTEGETTTSSMLFSTTYTSTVPTTPSTPSTPAPPQPCKFDCLVVVNGNIAHPTDCSVYYECISGMQNVRRCEYPKIFDAVTLVCGFPSSSVCANATNCG